MHTLVVDYLPEDVGILWFRKFFSNFGSVKDSVIPMKRSRISGCKFGFIRYEFEEEAKKAIVKANGLWIDNRSLVVKIANFDKKKEPRKDCFVNNLTRSQNCFMQSKPQLRGDNEVRPTYAQVTRGVESVVKGMNAFPSVISVKTSEGSVGEGGDWLSRSIVAKLPSRRSIESIRDAFISEGVFDIQIRSMGGNHVVLTFPSVEDMKFMIESPQVNWLEEENDLTDNLEIEVDTKTSKDDVEVSGIKDDTLAFANKGDQAKMSTPLGINQFTESSINEEECKETSQAEGNSFKDGAGSDFPILSGKDEVSAFDETPSFIGIHDVEVDPLLSRPPLFASDESISVAKEAALNVLSQVCKPCLDRRSMLPL
ncbi:hypothetical protein Vadar_005252 [Vaccinium darrowii]|uniref:Uncharacterized protein n=1 Tax=Vaccinium darrowii TaxID=229202 RepID=A0ACB7WY77_9ERIC|nr:hypothetical protein Vadar_005252 [Vaccinium darrowii]